jgi:hypothetical protein
MGWLRDKITAIREQFGDTPEADALVQDAEAQAMTEGEGDYHPPAARNVTARARYDSDAGLA